VFINGDAGLEVCFLSAPERIKLVDLSGVPPGPEALAERSGAVISNPVTDKGRDGNILLIHELATILKLDQRVVLTLRLLCGRGVDDPLPV